MTKWRPYVVVNKTSYGGVYTRTMRDTNTYPTKDAAIKAMKADNRTFVKLNYSKKQLANTTFDYGAVVAGKYPKGAKGNSQILKNHRKQKK